MARPIEPHNIGPCKAADDPGGCSDGKLRAGYCQRHYTRQWRTGSPYQAPKEPPESVMLAAGVTPLVPYPGNGEPWLCRCDTCNREVRPRRSNVYTRGVACALCTGKTVDPNECLEVIRAAGFTPLEPFTNSETRWECRCDRCGHQVGLLVRNIRNGGGCAYCVGCRVDPNEATEHMEAAGLTPLVPYTNAHTLWLCHCNTCGREVDPTYAAVRHQGVGCRYCAGCCVVPEEAFALMEAAGFTPLEPYTSTSTPWPCRCEGCGKTSTPAYAHIRTGGGCRYCANYGIDWDQPTILYLIRNKAQRAFKIGITNVHNTDPCYSRLRQHEKYGWVTVKQWVFDRGDTALETEQALLRYWRKDLGAPEALSREDMPQGGWTETASTRKVGLQRTIDYIEGLREKV